MSTETTVLLRRRRVRAVQTTPTAAAVTTTNHRNLGTMFAQRTGRQALQRALAASPSQTFTLPSFLVPAFHTPQTTTTPSSTSPLPTSPSRRNFSATTHRPSKLGRTPLTVPPGVDLQISDLFYQKDVTTYLKQMKRRITIKGPLGEQTAVDQVPAWDGG